MPIHSWQDIVFSIGALLFIRALIPMVRAPEKPPLQTSLITGLTLLSFCTIYFSYHLWFSLITGFATASLWLLLAVQKKRQQFPPKCERKVQDE